MKLLREILGAISKGIWPPRSPDLTPQDFFFWEAANAKVYKNNPNTLDKFKTTVIQFMQSVT
jgi:hypothetical protein